MIDTKDQEELFRLIAEYLKRDITCTAIGGTAMMFLGYKNTTKDIDLVFKSDSDRQAFIDAIEQLGYKEKSSKEIYSKPNRPKIYSRGEERFDLFVKKVFGFEIRHGFIQRQDFIGKSELILQVLPKELLILLKAITGRERDQEDIETIIDIEKGIDWDLIIDEAIRQKQSPWILIDLEEAMQGLKTKTFIKRKHFERIYKAQK